MASPRVFVTRKISAPALDLLAQTAEVTVWPEPSPPPREALLFAVRDADGLLSMLTETVDVELLASAPRLKAVSNMAVGYDNIDVAACTARQVVVGNTPGVLTETTADFAFALLLAGARRLVEADAYVRSGQ